MTLEIFLICLRETLGILVTFFKKLDTNSVYRRQNSKIYERWSWTGIDSEKLKNTSIGIDSSAILSQNDSLEAVESNPRDTRSIRNLGALKGSEKKGEAYI